jgi:CBS domain-containing protein
MSIRVEEIMSREVVTIEQDYSVQYASRLMYLFGISSLITVSGDEIVGILTEKDILTRIVAKGLNPEKVLVKDIASKPVLVVSPSTPLEDAVNIMFIRRIKKLPVVKGKGENAELVGILSLTDVAKLQPKMFETVRELAQISSNVPEAVVNHFVS